MVIPLFLIKLFDGVEFYPSNILVDSVIDTASLYGLWLYGVPCGFGGISDLPVIVASRSSSPHKHSCCKEERRAIARVVLATTLCCGMVCVVRWR